jgi:hypothetical protein
VCFHNFDQDQNNTRNVQVKFLLSVFCFPFHSLKPIRSRTLNKEKTWNGLTMRILTFIVFGLKNLSGVACCPSYSTYPFFTCSTKGMPITTMLGFPAVHVNILEKINDLSCLTVEARSWGILHFFKIQHTHEDPA